MEYKIIDCDQHVIEAPDLWEKYLPQKFQDKAPKLVKDEEGGDAWQFEPGGPLMYIGLVATPGMRFEDITARAGVAVERSLSVGSAFGDYDGDGDADLYVTTYRGGSFTGLIVIVKTYVGPVSHPPFATPPVSVSLTRLYSSLRFFSAA